MTCVLDTTAYSSAMRNEEGMVAFLRSRRPGDVALVPPVVAEIEYGIHRLVPQSRKRRLLRDRHAKLSLALRMLEWNAQASVEFGRVKARLEQTGSQIDDFDIAVAAIALAHGAEVITANLVHFSRIEGLAARHWMEADK